MLRDLRIFRRNSAKIPPAEGNNENHAMDTSESSAIRLEPDSSRPPFSTIQEHAQNPKLAIEQEANLRRKIERALSNNQIKISEAHLPLRTPEKPVAAKNKFGWAPKSDPGTDSVENAEESSHQVPFQLPPLSRATNSGNGSGFSASTPRTYRTAGKGSSVHSDSSSTHSTPTKSVSKPSLSSGFGSSRPPLGVPTRTLNISSAPKGPPISSTPSSAVCMAEVPHFELKEDPSFWMDNNVQVVIRVRPLNSMERSLQGYNRCLRQENAHSVTWIGQPEGRFTFDYVACETINQEMLFRVAGLPMVENCISGYNSCMFAYGQTGSGKTYTMLGEINDLEIRPSSDRGMTPRIFEFLFARIRAEEESRRDEKLKYNCKCSFLEIYNEQITDLLEPSSTNLLLREDLRKGVYVENLAEFEVETVNDILKLLILNLAEFEVETVNDILKLLILGAANRKVAATNMNRESSRSHSVFTCAIESKWEKDSTTNSRFARLNLVDLAGSERQKTSGAEGERLKEAANINKSLSTLGHVIMVLADLANGKQRHIPYRDSRLTFLLQDSLGGNSKTIIMANVSPSICSASETLSTLKFAQRARLIQNNAVVNEDASGDIMALRHQIYLLKEELSIIKRQNISRSLSFRTGILQDSENEGSNVSSSEKMYESTHESFKNEVPCSVVRVSMKQLKSLEATLTGALRREKMADVTIKQLEAEIEHLSRLVRQREEDTQGSKMMLKFREDKIQRMEALLDGLVPTDSYLVEENSALSEEIRLLRTKLDRNPEVTRFALENIRLLDQLRRFQDFYEEGERGLLLAEVSELRNQLIQFLDGKSESDQCAKADKVSQLQKTCQELEDCRSNLKSCLETNARLAREISNLRIELNNIQSSSNDAKLEPQNMEFCFTSPCKDSRTLPIKLDLTSEYMHTEEILNLQLELDIMKTILGEEKSSHAELERRAIHANHELKVSTEALLRISKHNEDLKVELKDARSVIEAFESQRIIVLNELEVSREDNIKYAELLKKQEQEISILQNQLGVHVEGKGKLSFQPEQLKGQPLKLSENEDSPLQVKLKRMQASLEKACSLSMRYKTDQVSQASVDREVDEVRRQVEVETAEVIICLQEELMTLQQRVDDSNRSELMAKLSLATLETEIKELNERLFLATQENERLHELAEEKERDLSSVTEDWERLAYEIADVLSDGNAAIEDASDQVASISDFFPHRSWISEQVFRMVKSISERDALIEELQKGLEDAQNVRCHMERKLGSLRGATLAITEAQQQETDNREREILLLTSQLSEKDVVITGLESRIEHFENKTRKSEILAAVAFMVVNRLSEINRTQLQEMENAKDMLNDSKGITEAQRQETDNREREILLLTSQLSEKDVVITGLESRIELLENKTRKSEILAAVAFMVVNRLSEINRTQLQGMENAKDMLNDSKGRKFQKDSLLQDHIFLHADAVKQIQDMKLQLEQSEEHIAQLKHTQEKEREQALGHQLRKEEDDLLKAKRVVNEIQIGVSTLHSCMNENVEPGSNPEVHNFENDSVESKTCHSKDGIKTISSDSVIDNQGHNVQTAGSIEHQSSTNADESESSRLLEDTRKETTIALLRKELESALDSLKEVQGQMFKLVNEKEEIKRSEIQCRKNTEHLSAQVLRLKSYIVDKEQQLESRMLELEHKLQIVEGNAIESNACWQKAKEVFELEITDSKALAAQKTVEISNLLKNIEEAQETMRDADIMVNALVEANESAKVEIERCQKLEITLNNENTSLISQVQALQSSLHAKEQEYECMQEKFNSNLTGARSLVLDLEDTFRQLVTTFTQKFELMTCDLDWLKYQFHECTELARTWLEETWSEIIGKDCAVSVLHLCHIGILLERITGLNAENGFLYHGISGSNSVIADLKEHNLKAKKELEVCSLLKGKLLFDINNSFNRITKKEDETARFKEKLNSFERKIQSLHSQEESMLARSNSMGFELVILMKELDANKKDSLEAVSVKNKLLKENEKLRDNLEVSTRLLDEENCIHEMLRDTIFQGLNLVFKSDAYSSTRIADLNSCNMDIKKRFQLDKNLIDCQTETIMTNIFAKDLELLVLTFEIEQKAAELNHVTSQVVDMERQSDIFNRAFEKMKEDIVIYKIDGELKSNVVCSLLMENEELKTELLNLKEDHSKTIKALEEAKIGFASSLSHANGISNENHKLEAIVYSLEVCVADLQSDLDKKNAEIEEIMCSYTVISKELNGIQVGRMNALETENDSLKNAAAAFKREQDEVISILNSKLNNCFDMAQSAIFAVEKTFDVIDEQNNLLMDRMYQEHFEHKEMVSKFVDELDCLVSSAKELLYEKSSLHLSLSQESASIAKNQKDEFERLSLTLESLEYELARKSCELDGSIAHQKVVEAQLLEKNEKISALESKIAEKDSSLTLVSTENLELKAHIEVNVGLKNRFEQEFMENIRVTERLEEEILLTSTLLEQRNHCLEDFQSDLTKLACERDHLKSVVLVLKEKLEMTQALAEENEAIATEARQIAEGSKVYAEDKEEEVRLLERSVEELECTVNALENKVEIVKGEAEKQWLQREELEIELEAVRNQMLAVSGNTCNDSEGGKIDLSRHLTERLSEIEDSQQYIQFLQKEVAERDAEIVQCKAHISELNMHADAQAREYKLKFKELEAMAQQVRADPSHSNATSLTSTKADKGAAKSRGSGSPFKCIGLGLSQQINSEKDEELTAATCRIEELEDLVARRQKEVFMLNTRLAAAESMTHDVIRDLLGVKLDMTNYASLLDHQQVQKVKEITRFDSKESQDKEKEVSKLKKQINDFIEERQSWLDEIHQRQTEMVAARILSEKLRQREQSLVAENEILMADTAKYKKIVMELEDEVKKLSNQPNFQQRIHHHTKIKEENNRLRIQNEELNAELEQSDHILSRVKEELARYRASSGKKQYIDIDEEERLREKLNYSEEERIQLAQKLLSLCTIILKAAGLPLSASCISPSVAEDALDQLKIRINSLEHELQDLRLQCRLSCEKLRLSEIKQQQLSQSSEDSEEADEIEGSLQS